MLAIINMKHYLFHILSIFILLGFWSCKSDSMKCEPVQEWKVQDYKIVKLKCPDLVLAFYFTYEVYADDKRKGNAALQADSCNFTWQADNESFLTLNVCNNSIQELKPNKVPLDRNTIDSVTIFSNEFKRSKTLTNSQIDKFEKDWDNSETRGYSEEPFDSAFSFSPAYQYKLTVFSKGQQQIFYGYNYIILDSSNWKFEMSENSKLNYFHNYWKKTNYRQR